MSCLLEALFESKTYHLNPSLTILNHLLLDLSTVDLISIVHMNKIWVEVLNQQINFEVWCPGGQ